MQNLHSHHTASAGATRRGGRQLLTIAAAAIALIGVSACASRPVPADLGIPWGATVKSIVSNPQQAAGKIVTVSGEVNRVFGPRWFSIGGEGFDGGEELLVVGATRVPALLDNLADSGKISNDLVQVTGRVRFFERAALEQEIGADLGGDWWRAYEQKPVVVMTDLDVTPRVDVVPVVAVPVPVPVSVAPITDQMLIVSTPNRGALAGRSVALLDVKVQTVVGKNTFWVGPSPSQQLFVVADSNIVGLEGLRVGQTISIAGVLQAMPGDFSSVRSAWSLSAANQATLAREAVYLQATSMYRHGMAGTADESRIRVQKDQR